MQLMSNFKALRVSAVVALSCFMLVGCGDDDATTTDEGDTITTEDSTEPGGEDSTEPDPESDTTTDPEPEEDTTVDPEPEEDVVVPEDDTTGPDEPGTIPEVATAAGDFGLLLAAVEAAGLAETLSGEGPFTVFAPNDAAITATLAALNMTVEDLVADVDYLTKLLTYHVVAGEVLAADVVELTEATTLQGEDIKIEVKDGGVVLNGSVNVVATDVMASNGVIHVIDFVLVPPSLAGGPGDDKPEPIEIPETYNFGNPGCYSGPPTHACDCSVKKADCMPADGSTFPMWTDTCSVSCSSVKYTGQTMRQVLILDLKRYIGELTGLVDGTEDTGGLDPADADEILAELDFYFSFDADTDGADTDLPAAYLLSKDANPITELLESVYADISTSNLQGKLAGNDAKTDHKCWDPNNAKAGDNPNCADATEGAFAGWTGITTPDGMVDAWFGMVADNAVKRENGEIDWPVHLTPEGHDLNQLIQKFLTVAITFSQGADDYLDDDMAGKGLMASNVLEEGASYTGLAHAWDEGFGYFGAARDYAAYTDDEIAGKGGANEKLVYFDTNGDEMISLKSEYNFAASQNAAKRDRGSKNGAAPTDFTKDIFDAFLAGRTLIHNNPGELSEELMTELKGYRDTIVWGWEKAFAATAIHYINDTLGDMANIATDAAAEEGADATYSFTDHAKHWGELKGFALGFQFSPHSPLSDEDFVKFHDLIGTAPVLADGDLTAYEADLLEARDILRDAYEFDADNAASW
mgnify:CR=1 FL=1